LSAAYNFDSSPEKLANNSPNLTINSLALTTPSPRNPPENHPISSMMAITYDIIC
jgi:hypothetical protein